MKNYEKGIVGIFLTVILVLALFLTFRDNNDPKIIEKTDTFKEGVMQGCIDEGTASYAYCSCAYDYLIDKYTKSEILDMGIEYNNTGDIPKGMVDAASACIDLY